MRAAIRSDIFLLPKSRRPNPGSAIRTLIPMSRHPHRSGAWAQFPMPRHPHPSPVRESPESAHPDLRLAWLRGHGLRSRWRRRLRHDDCPRGFGSGCRRTGWRLGRRPGRSQSMTINASAQYKPSSHDQRQNAKYLFLHNFLSALPAWPCRPWFIGVPHSWPPRSLSLADPNCRWGALLPLARPA